MLRDGKDLQTVLAIFDLVRFMRKGSFTPLDLVQEEVELLLKIIRSQTSQKFS